MLVLTIGSAILVYVKFCGFVFYLLSVWYAILRKFISSLLEGYNPSEIFFFVS